MESMKPKSKKIGETGGVPEGPTVDENGVVHPGKIASDISSIKTVKSLSKLQKSIDKSNPDSTAPVQAPVSDMSHVDPAPLGQSETNPRGTQFNNGELSPFVQDMLKDLLTDWANTNLKIDRSHFADRPMAGTARKDSSSATKPRDISASKSSVPSKGKAVGPVGPSPLQAPRWALALSLP